MGRRQKRRREAREKGRGREELGRSVVMVVPPTDLE